MTILIYIDDLLLDLSVKTSVSFTYQTGGIGDIRSRFVSHTNEFRVDKTETNTKIFGYADNVKSTSDIPYRKSTCKILINGLQVIKGYAFLRETTDTFRVSVFETTVDFFSVIEGIPLSQLDFNDSPVTWSATYIDGRRASTSNLVAPAIQYGQLDPTLVNAEIGDVYLPSVYYHTIISAIFENAGYTKTGDVFSLPKYTSLILAYSKETWPGTTFTMDEIMPEDITQDEFIKHFSMAFGAIFRERDGVITVKLFEEIINDRLNAQDWTAKRATNIADRIVYGFSNYGQNNNFRNADVNGATGVLLIDNENLELNVDIYESPFARVYADSFIANDNGDIVNGAIIPVWFRAGWTPPTLYPPDEDFFNEPIPRILAVRARIAPEPAILYDGNSRTDYLVGSYDSAFGNVSVAWQADGRGFLEIYYASLQDRISRAKTIERYYNLSLLDIAQLDLFKLVYDDGAYYFINRIVNFVPGKVTKVELFKV